MPNVRSEKVRLEVCATVSGKGQVVIPLDVRRRLGIVQGSVVRFQMDEEGVRMLPPAGDVKRLKGRLNVPPSPVSVDDMNDTIRRRRAELSRA